MPCIKRVTVYWLTCSFLKRYQFEITLKKLEITSSCIMEDRVLISKIFRSCAGADSGFRPGGGARILGTNNLKIGTKYARVGTKPLRLGTTPLRLRKNL